MIQQSRKRPVPEVAPELLCQVSGMCNNLNQIARRLNQSDFLPSRARCCLRFRLCRSILCV
ncbi:TPA: plasmid mobilization relaxosome protein MobC [Klebsiella pneumoniae]|nr:plasmid mobilization relaxosome protein MobC [Klebsiella pneumoniae]